MVQFQKYILTGKLLEFWRMYDFLNKHVLTLRPEGVDYAREYLERIERTTSALVLERLFKNIPDPDFF